MGVLEILTQFAEETSVHALAYVVQTSSSRGKRVAWMCLFLGSLIYAVVQIKYLAHCKFKGCFTCIRVAVRLLIFQGHLTICIDLSHFLKKTWQNAEITGQSLDKQL